MTEAAEPILLVERDGPVAAVAHPDQHDQDGADAAHAVERQEQIGDEAAHQAASSPNRSTAVAATRRVS